VAGPGARADPRAKGVTTNGLVTHRPSMPNLGDYYRTSITGGPRSFVIQAKSRRTFADAIVKKLILEISDLVPDRQHAAHRAQ